MGGNLRVTCVKRCLSLFYPNLFETNIQPRSQMASSTNSNSKQGGATKKKKSKGKRSKNKETSSSNNAKFKRPNYFIGTRFSNPEIVGKILAIQEHIKSQKPDLTNACIPVATTHVTLAVLHLEDDTALEKAGNILLDCKEEILDILENAKLELIVKDLGNFQHQVLFAKLLEDSGLDNLMQIAELIQRKLHEFINKGDSFKPHLTILKLSRMKQKHKKIKKINSSLYKPFASMNFGNQTISSIELLSMTKKKQMDGYYHSDAVINIGTGEEQVDERLSLDKWAESIAVCCLTTAMLPKNKKPLPDIHQYADDLARSILQKCLSQDAGLLQMKQKLHKFRQTINSGEILTRIKQETSTDHGDA